MLLALLGLPVLPAVAAPPATAWQSHAAIRAAAQQFLDEFVDQQHLGRSEIRLGKLDQRLRLKNCHGALQAFMPRGSRSMGNTTVGVRCPDDDGWSIYVAARVDIFGPVLVARQPLARGARIHAADLEPVERNLANLPYGYYTDQRTIVGKLAKRMIAGATVITPALLQAPKLVKRGDQVSVIAEIGTLKIRSAGKAMSDGQSGDRIRVRATGSRRIVDGIVISAGVVKVTL